MVGADIWSVRWFYFTFDFSNGDLHGGRGTKAVQFRTKAGKSKAHGGKPGGVETYVCT